MAFDVLVTIFDGRNAQYYEQGEDDQAWRNRAEFTEELQDSNTEEETKCRCVNINSQRKKEKHNTHTLATRLNCSSRFLGRNVRMVYFEVMT